MFFFCIRFIFEFFLACFARLPYNLLGFDYVKHLLFKILACYPQLHYNAFGFDYVN